MVRLETKHFENFEVFCQVWDLVIKGVIVVLATSKSLEKFNR